MKKLTLISTIFLAFIILLSIKTLNAQDWQWQNPLPQGNDLLSTCFVDSSVGYAVGDRGTIIKTTDGGETWILQDSVTDVDLNSVFFVDENYGYIAGQNPHNSDKIFLKTTDGGNNWIESSNIPYGVKDIFFVSADTGFIVGYYAIPETGWIQRTTDGGYTWSYYEAPNFVGSVFFPSNNIGYAVGKIIMKTTDCGLTWTTQYGAASFGLTDVYFIDENIGFAVSGGGEPIGLTLKTINGGTNWSIQSTGEGYLYSIFFKDEMNGYGTGHFGEIKKTTNGGINWTDVNSGTNKHLNSLFFSGSSTGYIVGEDGIILKTIDSGTTWVNQLAGPTNNLHSVYFTDGHKGYAVGDSGLILKTIDAGTNWLNMPSGNTNHLLSVFFVGSDTAYAAGAYGTVLKTIDAGISWTGLTSGTQQDLNSIFFPSNTTGYAVGNLGIILKTVDGGSNWTSLASGVYDYSFTSAYFTSENRGYVVGRRSGFMWNAIILYTNDGGTNWITQSETIGYNNSVFFPDDNTGYITDFGLVLKTIDGGENWYEHEVGPGINWQSIYFMNSDVGYISGGDEPYDEYMILKTIDGGETFFVPENQNLSCNHSLNSIFFPTPDTGYFVGNNGSILRAITEGIPLNTNSMNRQKNIIKIYPNPVSNQFFIDYQLNLATEFSIELFDLYGNKIEIITQKKQQPGRYQQSYDITELPTGIYLLHITAGDVTTVRKIIKV